MIRKLMLVLAVAMPSVALGGIGAQAGEGNLLLAQADASAKYTIQVESGDAAAMSSDAAGTSEPNRKTAPGAVADTIAANPGLAEALEKQGVKQSSIQTLMVEPDKVVHVYTK